MLIPGRSTALAQAMREVTASALRAMLLDGGEIALLDVREEGAFTESHILLARPLPLSRLELRILALVPRKTVRIVLCDAGGGLAEQAAQKLTSYGYSDIAILAGGIKAWEIQGFVLFSGFNVPSKAFGEFIEHAEETPNISAQTLKQLIDDDADFLVLDSRPWDEYRRMSIPTGVDAPGAELVYRVHDLAPGPGTLVVVNCAGRTRSIIGAQPLINAGIPNKVVALRNGTMGWVLAGFKCEHGSERTAPLPSAKALAAAKVAAARVAKRFEVKYVDAPSIDTWRKDPNRTLFILDVRTSEEFAEGHIPGSIHAPGGQLVQATDLFIGVLGARLVLVDDHGVRATMTASWLIQMGWRDVYVWDRALEQGARDSGPYRALVPEAGAPEANAVTPMELHGLLEDDSALVIDIGDSRAYRRGHIPGAWFAVRSRLSEAFTNIPSAARYVFTSSDGELARLAAADAHTLTNARVSYLSGGTTAWHEARFSMTKGEENMADIADDVSLKPYDRGSEIRQAMEDYLAWELALPGQIEADGTVEFRLFPGDPC